MDRDVLLPVGSSTVIVNNEQEPVVFVLCGPYYMIRKISNKPIQFVTISDKYSELNELFCFNINSKGYLKVFN